MARLNRSVAYEEKTHEGGRADAHLTSYAQLERAVATCLLWENTFYEKGSDIAQRIADLCKEVPVEQIAALAIKARNEYKLRHVPLFLTLQLDALARKRNDGLVRKTIAAVVQRPDEMGELLAMMKDANKKKLSHQVEKGLREAFGKFSRYQLLKWDRDAAIKLRDVMFLVHPKPRPELAGLFKQIADQTVVDSADTWEVALSAGKDKKETWERLLREEKLGYMALLMNLRNMEAASVDRSIVENALTAGAKNSKALPFRFVSAFKAAPSYAQALSDSMIQAIEGAAKLKGTTVLLVDVSGSMDAKISAKSQLDRLDAAAALGILLREICQTCRVFTFSTSLVEVANLRGLGMLDGVSKSQPHGGTELAAALTQLRSKVPNADRVIVVTDEQSSDGNGRNWTKHGYICNVAPYKPGLETDGGWYRVNGWSERIVDWILAEEALGQS